MLGMLYHAQNRNKHDGADHRHDNRTECAVGSDAEKAEEVAADDGADDAHDDVTNDAVTTAMHDLPGKPASDEADEEEPKYVHRRGGRKKYKIISNVRLIVRRPHHVIINIEAKKSDFDISH